MTTISQSAGPLMLGVSQQPPALMNPGYAKEQINAVSDPVLGLSKRAGTRYQREFNAYLPTDAYWHWYERGEERYALLFDGQALQAFTSLGEPLPVTAPQSVIDYLSAGSGKPQDKLRSITVNDTTIIANSEQTVAKASSTGETLNTWGIVWVKTGTYNQKYTVETNVAPVAYEPGEGDGTAGNELDNIQTDNIADQLRTSVHAQGGITATISAGESVFKVEGMTSLEGYDSQGNSSVKAFINQVDSFDDLPTRCYPGTTVKVIGLADSEADDYWVKFVGEVNQTTTEIQAGIWEEIAEPAGNHEIDQTTMPVQVSRVVTNGEVSFTASLIDWGDRGAGDSDSNKDPSFVGSEIDAVFLAQNRLGFVTSDKLVLSRADDLYQFYRTTVTSLPDDERVDLTINNSRGTRFYTAVQLDDEVLLLGNGYQASILLIDPISPSSVTVTEASTLQLEDRVQPAKAGRSLFLAERSGADYSGVREMYSMSDRRKATEESSQLVPNYIPGRVLRMDVSTPRNSLFVLADGERRSLINYQWLNSGNQRVQSAWSKFDFGEVTVLDFRAYDDYITLAVMTRNRLQFETLPLDHTEPVLEGETPWRLDRMWSYNVEQPEPETGDIYVHRTDTDPDIEVPQGSLINLGSITEGESAPSCTVQLRNDGVGDLDITAILQTNSFFTVTPSAAPVQTLAPNAALNLTITLAETAVGSYVTEISVVSNDDDESTYVFSVGASITSSGGGGGEDPWGEDPQTGSGVADLDSAPSIETSTELTFDDDGSYIEINLPYLPKAGTTVVIDGSSGRRYSWTQPTYGTTIRVYGAQDAANLIVGDLFLFKYIMGEARLVRSGPGGSPAPVINGWLNVLRWHIRGDGPFTLRCWDLRSGVLKAARESSVYRVGDRRGAAAPRFSTSVPVFRRAHEVEIDIYSMDAQPVIIQAAEWEGEWFGDSRMV